MYCALEISLTTIQIYVWSFSICCLQHSSPFADSPLQILLRRFPVADSPIASTLAQIVIVFALVQSAIILVFARICPGAFAIVSFFAHSPICTFARSCLMQTWLRSRYLANLGSTLVQFPPQDCRLAIPQFILGQSPLHDQPSAIWPLTLGQKSSYNLPLTLRRVIFDQLVIAQSAPDRSALCSSISLTSLIRLSFVFSCWALPFVLEVVVIGDQLTTLKAAPLLQF